MEWTDAVRRPPSHVAYGNCLFFMVWAADTAATMVRPRLIVISLSLECFFFRDYYKTNLFFYSLQARPPRSAACRVCFFFVVLSDPVGFVLASVLFWALSRSAFTWCNRLIPSPVVICIETAFQVYLDNKSSCELVNHHPSPSDDAAVLFILSTATVQTHQLDHYARYIYRAWRAPHRSFLLFVRVVTHPPSCLECRLFFSSTFESPWAPSVVCKAHHRGKR